MTQTQPTGSFAPETRVQHTETLAWGTYVRALDGAAVVLWDGLGLALVADPENLRPASTRP
jgi:hypothetical protein